MVVGKDYCVDWREPVEVDSRRGPSSRASEFYRGSALAPYRIRQYVEAGELDEEAGMTYPRDTEYVRCATRNRVFRSHSLEYAWIGIRLPTVSSSLDQRPFEKIEKAVQFSGRPGIQKSASRLVVSGNTHFV